MTLEELEQFFRRFRKFQNSFFEFIIEILRIRPDFFCIEFKKMICKILYPRLTDFLHERRNRISSIKKFLIGFSPTINQLFYDDIISQPFILYYLLDNKPEDIEKLFPELVQKGYYGIGYNLILKFNHLITQYEIETSKILGNIIIFEKQYRALINLLERENRELIEIVENHRETLKEQFFSEFISYTIEELEAKKFERNPEDIFRYTLDCYTNEEIRKIIEKAIALKFKYEYHSKHSWIHLLLLDKL